MSISDNHRGNDSLNLGRPSKPKYATEQQDETVAIIRSSFRSEMSNFSNSIKYLGKLLNFQIFPVANKKDCTTAHLFGFSQQTGLCFRPQMKLQKLTQDVLKNLGSMVRTSGALNHVPKISPEHVCLHVPFVDGDNPTDGVKKYTAYHSYLKKRKKGQIEIATS